MADGRMLKKTIANSKKLAVVNDRARVIWFMMLPHTDIEGRLKACPQIVKGQYLTMLKYSEAAIQKNLEELHRAGLIILYKVGENQYAQFTRFKDFQSLREDREGKSDIPPPESGTTPGVPPEESPLNLSKDKLREDKRKFKPPSLQEIKDYIKTDPKLSNVNPDVFYKFFAVDADPKWTDSNGKPVKNWKQKLRTWSSHGKPNDSQINRRDSFREQESRFGKTITD